MVKEKWPVTYTTITWTRNGLLKLRKFQDRLVLSEIWHWKFGKFVVVSFVIAHVKYML